MTTRQQRIVAAQQHTPALKRWRGVDGTTPDATALLQFVVTGPDAAGGGVVVSCCCAPGYGELLSLTTGDSLCPVDDELLLLLPPHSIRTELPRRLPAIHQKPL